MVYQRSPRNKPSTAAPRVVTATPFKHDAVHAVSSSEHRSSSHREASRFVANLSQVPTLSIAQKKAETVKSAPYKITSSKSSRLGYQEINAVAGSEQVGTVKIKGISQHKLEIGDLSVAPQHRQQGISKSLLSAAMSEGKKQGYSTGQLGVQPKSPDMHQSTLTGIYARQGFKPTPKKLNGVPAMERKL